jgi:tetratricopeptide (TPR) repeat protein
VINPTSVRQYRNSELPIRQIANDLNVDAVIQGSAALDADALALELYMTDGLTDEVVWADSFDGTVEGVLGIYADVIRAIAAATGLELSESSTALLAAAPAVDPQVQEDLWWARFHRTKLSQEGLALALEYYDRVLARDPRNAEALVGLGGVWGSRAQMGFVSAAEAAERQGSAFESALAIDSLNAQVQASLANNRTWSEWDFAAADETFARALQADPTNSVSRALHSHLLHYLGRDEEARMQIARALEQDPLNAQIRTYYGMELVYERDYARADSVLRAVIEDEPDYRMALTTMRTNYHLMGRHDEALDMWRASNARDPEAIAALERGYAVGGYEGALSELAAMFIARSRTTYVPPWQIGTLYTRAGNAELALDYLERAFEERDPNIPYLSVDPIFDYLRDEPRFRSMIERLGL